MKKIDETETQKKKKKKKKKKNGTRDTEAIAKG